MSSSVVNATTPGETSEVSDEASSDPRSVSGRRAVDRARGSRAMDRARARHAGPFLSRAAAATESSGSTESAGVSISAEELGIEVYTHPSSSTVCVYNSRV